MLPLSSVTGFGGDVAECKRTFLLKLRKSHAVINVLVRNGFKITTMACFLSRRWFCLEVVSVHRHGVWPLRLSAAHGHDAVWDTNRLQQRSKHQRTRWDEQIGRSSDESYTLKRVVDLNTNQDWIDDRCWIDFVHSYKLLCSQLNKRELLNCFM